jgi:hypothetical protein
MGDITEETTAQPLPRPSGSLSTQGAYAALPAADGHGGVSIAELADMARNDNQQIEEISRMEEVD